jgi:hypothetical protein
MRGMRRFILVGILFIIGLPFAVGGAAMIKDKEEPSYLVNFDYASYDENSVLTNKLQSMTLSNVLGVKKIYIDEETVNKIIYKDLDGFTDQTYIVDGTEKVSIKSIWTTFHNNELSMYLIFQYRQVETSVTVQLGIVNNEDNVQVQLNSVKVGQLPIPKSLMTYGLKSLEDFENVDLSSQYELGDFNLDELYVTVGQNIIDNVISYYLDSDLIVFKNIELQNGKLILEYDFNPDNPKQQALNNTITEIKRVITDDTTKSSIENALDLTNETDVKFNDDINQVIDTILIPRIDHPDDYGTNDFTSNEETLLLSLNTDFSALDNPTKDKVITGIVDNVDPEVLGQFEKEILPMIGTDQSSEQLLSTYLSSSSN